MATPKNPTARIWKATKDSAAGFAATETNTIMAGDSKHYIVVDEKGTYIKGPTSFIADAASRRVGGLWTGINDFLHMIPSTLFTPIPQQIIMPPLFATAQIARDTAYFTAFLS